MTEEFAVKGLELQEHRDGVVLPVRAQPGARRSGLTGVHDGALKIAVTQAAEKGKANAAIVTLLSKELSVPKSRLLILSGETSSRKRILIQGAALSEVSKIITEKLAS